MCWFAQILLPLENTEEIIQLASSKLVQILKTSALKDHESSKLHTDAVAHFEAIENSYNKLWQSKHRFLLMNINDTNYKIIFEMYIHAFVNKKNNSPIRDIIWLTALDKAKNIDVGETYSNWKSATTFMEYISEAKTKVTDLEVGKNAKFYSLSMDGRTNEGCVEQKTLFVRVCNQSKWTHKFFTLGNPPQLVLQICMHLCWTISITYR